MQREQAYIQKKWGREVISLDRSKQSPGSGYAITVQIPQTYEQSMKAGHIKG